MTDKEKIRAEIKRRIDLYKDAEHISANTCGYLDANETLISFIDSMLQEPVIEDLEKAIGEHFNNGMALQLDWKQCDITFKASRLIVFANYIAQWQKEQMMKDAVSAYIRRNRYTKTNVLNGFSVTCDAVQKFKDKDKVKVIIIKDE